MTLKDLEVALNESDARVGLLADDLTVVRADMDGLRAEIVALRSKMNLHLQSLPSSSSTEPRSVTPVIDLTVPDDASQQTRSAVPVFDPTVPEPSQHGKSGFNDRDIDRPSPNGLPDREMYKRCPSLLYERNNSGETALFTAITNRNLELMNFLIYGEGKEMKPDKKLLKMVRTNMFSVLHYAVETYNVRAVKLLIQADHDKELLRMRDIKKNTALHMAVYNNDSEIMKVLCDADGDKKLLGIVNFDKETPLHLAVLYENLEQVQILTECGPEFRYCANKSGMNPLSLAIQMELVDIVNHILQTCSSSSFDEPNVTSALQLAINTTNLDIRKLLLEKVWLEDKGWTLLHYAASTYRGHTFGGAFNAFDFDYINEYCPSVVKMVDLEGKNFLHIAAIHDNADFVTRILSKGTLDTGVLNGKDNDGKTPFDGVSEHFYQQVRPYLNGVEITTKRKEILPLFGFGRPISHFG